MRSLFLCLFLMAGLAVLFAKAEPAPASTPVTPDAVEVKSESFSEFEGPIGSRNKNKSKYERFEIRHWL